MDRIHSTNVMVATATDKSQAYTQDFDPVRNLRERGALPVGQWDSGVK